MRSAKPQPVTTLSAIASFTMVLQPTALQNGSHRISSHRNQGHALLTCLLPQLFLAAWLPLMWESLHLQLILVQTQQKRCSDERLRSASLSGPS